MGKVTRRRYTAELKAKVSLNVKPLRAMNGSLRLKRYAVSAFRCCGHPAGPGCHRKIAPVGAFSPIVVYSQKRHSGGRHCILVPTVMCGRRRITRFLVPGIDGSD
jgi:hypothetical protein